jgi:von Willebrand factor type A domain-containing protein
VSHRQGQRTGMDFLFSRDWLRTVLIAARQIRRCAVILIIVFAVGAKPAAGQSARGNVDWIFVLDTSASMHGAGGTADIFGKVKDAISDFIRTAREGDTLTLYTFDRDTSLRGHIRVSGDIDKTDLLKIVNDLPSEGDRTYTGKAIHDALQRAADLKQRPDSANRTIAIILFTDGLEDVRGIPNSISIPSNIALLPKSQPYIFFVSVGQVHEGQLESFVNDPAMANRGEVIRDPGASRIEAVAERIRNTVEAPAQPVPINLTINPSTLSLGQIEPGDTINQVVELQANVNCRLRITLQNPGSEGLTLTEPTSVIALNAGTKTLSIRLTAANTLANGEHKFSLLFAAEPVDSGAIASTTNVEAAITVVKTPLWRKLIKYLLLLIALIVIALVVLSAIKGEPPWIWLPMLIERETLQGELQVIQPRPARVEDEFISLTQLHTRKVSLSSLIPSSIDGADAELEVLKQNGKLNVKLQRIKGALYVNKIEVANSKIYNDDVIELGGSKLRFSWVNHDRPSSDDAASEI